MKVYIVFFYNLGDGEETIEAVFDSEDKALDYIREHAKLTTYGHYDLDDHEVL